jgi:cation diffusion facilitator family transporter
MSAHGHSHEGHGHSHGLVHDSIKRSREGVRAVLVALGVLGAAALAQTAIFVLSGSVALLADLIHNFGDALTAVPLGIAFLMQSERAERTAGLFVVGAIFVSACVAGVEAVRRLIHPQPPSHLWALAAAGVIGYAGNSLAAGVRTRAGRRLDSPALIADGNHARADAYVSLGVVASAVVVALGAPIADPLIGLGITLVIPADHMAVVADCAPRPLTTSRRKPSSATGRLAQVAPRSPECQIVPSPRPM